MRATSRRPAVAAPPPTGAWARTSSTACRAAASSAPTAARSTTRISSPAASSAASVREPARGRWATSARRDDWADEPSAARSPAPRRLADATSRADERRQVAPRRDDCAPRRRSPRREPPPARRRPAESWTDGRRARACRSRASARSSRGWSPSAGQELDARARREPDDRARDAPSPSPSPLAEPPARRTVVISGHPDRLPVARTPRPPRTAVERIGASPDRIVGYAVLLGFVLVLIAVLTTGQ